MDVKEQVKEQIKTVFERITRDKSLQEQFQREPVKALESILGVDLPDEIIHQVIQGVSLWLIRHPAQWTR